MNAPPFLIASALMFWGWFTGWIIPAILVAALLEGSRGVSFRLTLTTTDFRRVWNLCAILFLGAAAILYSSTKGAWAIYSLILWLPMIFAPMVAAQAYSLAGEVEPRVFSGFYRRSIAAGDKPFTVSVIYPYLAIIMVSTSAANDRTIWFSAALIALIAWTLWSVKNHRISPAKWIALISLAAVIGYTGSFGWHLAHKKTAQLMMNLYARFFHAQLDPFMVRTAIGEIGEMKMTNVIRFRVDNNGTRDSIYIPHSSYNLYRKSAWFASKSEFRKMTPENNGITWKLGANDKTERVVTISSGFSRGRGLLMGSNGTFEIERLQAIEMSRNRMGAIKMAEGPEFASYSMKIGPNASLNGPPDTIDYKVPENIEPVLDQIVEELDLKSKKPAEIARTLERWFDKNFSYSLDLKSGMFGRKPLADFLMNVRSGHCEYFATATVMLLRKAGVPARYAVGYMAHEYSELEGQIVVRSKDSHSWALVWLDGAWKILDTTPGSWVMKDRSDQSSLQPLYDLWSYAKHVFNKWRWSDEENDYQIIFIIALIPLSFFLVWRIVTRPKVKIDKHKESASRDASLGAGPGFHEIEKQLNEMGYERGPGETPVRWIYRIRKESGNEFETEKLLDIISLHYKSRFDPMGLADAEKERLHMEIQEWLETVGRSVE